MLTVLKEQMDRKFSACENYKSWVEQSECKNRVVNSEPRYRNNRFFQEIVAYRSLLIEKVKANQLTEAEARYALVQKVSEIDRQVAKMRAEDRRLDLIEREQDMRAHQDRMNRMNAVIQQNNDRMMETIKNNQQNTTTPAPVYTSPTTTNCEPDGYGGMRCTTY